MTAKWTKGGVIDDPETAMRFILNGDVIFEGDKPQNAGWTQNWSVLQIKRLVGRRRLSIALPANIGERA